ncbi:uncharacterized protein PG998_014104 [Apiospora kogelbergensis]|uniref:Uncharacterized protein n=1 Tax=Apiospora kogelbergensis TaxID=1337665 RepID=A0AAW0QYR3_9PEZI
MFTIGNVAKNAAFNSSGASADPTSPLYKELVAKYHYMRDPLVPMAEDVEFHDFIRSQIMEKAIRAKKNESDLASVSGSTTSTTTTTTPNNDKDRSGCTDIPQRSAREPKKKASPLFKRYLRFSCFEPRSTT